MSNTLLIYNQLRAAGVSRAGALGLLGNWKAESGLEPSRLQNDFSANRIYSHAYTADVTAGRITRTQFARDRSGAGRPCAEPAWSPAYGGHLLGDRQQRPLHPGERRPSRPAGSRTAETSIGTASQ